MMKKRRKAFLIFILSALMVLTCAPDVFAEDVSASGTDSETSGLDPMSVNDVMITISPDIGTQDVLYTNTAYSYTYPENNTKLHLPMFGCGMSKLYSWRCRARAASLSGKKKAA